MPEYPYSNVQAKIKPLLAKIKTLGVPNKIDFKWLNSIGYTSSNDATLIPVFKFVNLIDSVGQPTEVWRNFRGDSKALAVAIRTAYKDLFDTYPNAQNESKATLTNFFSPKTTGGSQVISKMVGTFLEICGGADFSGTFVQQSHTPAAPNPTSTPPQALKTLGNGVVVNINIQLTVPETKDEKIYEAFFSAMKKHLLS